MFIGHFVPTELLQDAAPGTPRWIALTSPFGLTKKNPLKSGRAYAVFALVGFAAAILMFSNAFETASGY